MLIPYEEKVDVITPINILFIGGGEFWSLMKIKLMLLPQSTYCSEGVANFDVMIIMMWWCGGDDYDDHDHDHDDCKCGDTGYSEIPISHIHWIVTISLVNWSYVSNYETNRFYVLSSYVLGSTYMELWIDCLCSTIPFWESKHHGYVIESLPIDEHLQLSQIATDPKAYPC